MNGRRYRIRLYGHTSPEPQKFIKNLAAFLCTDEQQAQAVLEQAPIVIKEGLDKERANVLQEALGLMRALSILEPMEGEEASEPTKLEAVDQILDAYRTSAQEAAEPWYTRRWVLGGTAAGIIVLLLIGVALVPGLRRTGRPVPAQNPPGRGAVMPDSQQPRQETYKGWSLEELNAELEAVDANIEELKQRRIEALQALTTLQNTFGSDPVAIAEKKQEVQQIRFSLKASQRDKTIIERRMRTHEGSR